MKKIFILFVTFGLLLSMCLYAQNTIVVPLTNSATFTISTNVQDNMNFAQDFDAIKMVVSLVKSIAAGKWSVSLLIFLLVLIIGLLNSLIIAVIWLTPTKKDDLWLDKTYLPIFVRWVKPIVQALLNFRGK